MTHFTTGTVRQFSSSPKFGLFVKLKWFTILWAVYFIYIVCSNSRSKGVAILMDSTDLWTALTWSIILGSKMTIYPGLQALLFANWITQRPIIYSISTSLMICQKTGYANYLLGGLLCFPPSHSVVTLQCKQGGEKNGRICTTLSCS